MRFVGKKQQKKKAINYCNLWLYQVDRAGIEPAT
jgi:hypothetical protein